METVTWTLTSPHVKQTANGHLLCASGNADGALWPPRGGRGRGVGKVAEGGDIRVPAADSC